MTSTDANGQKKLSLGGRLLLGALMMAAGVFPILAAFDAGPLFRQEDINGPPWLAMVAGGIFLAGGIAVLVGEAKGGRLFSQFLAFAIFLGFAAIGNWIAFGPGPRECSVGLGDSVSFDSAPNAGGLACRIGFGIGAGILNGVILLMLGRGLAKCTGANALAKAIDKVGMAVLLISLSPILVPVFSVMIAKSLIEGFIEYRRTGKWPRNEAFIARMRRKKRAAPQDKPDDQSLNRS